MVPINTYNTVRKDKTVNLNNAELYMYMAHRAVEAV